MQIKGCLLGPVAGLLATLHFGCGVQAQTYPDRPIRIIIPFAPGGSADLVSRTIAAQLSDSLGKPVVVESRAGAGGVIGVEAVVHAAADGYTLLSTAGGTVAVIGHLQKLRYDVAKDLVPVAMVAIVGAGIGVNSSLPIHNVAQLIKASKDNPNGLNFSHSGVGTNMHLSGELLKYMTNANFVPIPYRGTSPAVEAILSGDVPFGISDLTSLLPMAEAGKLRIIAVINSQRIGSAPDVPTVAESGVAGYAADPWLGIFAPAGTPPEIVQRLNAEIRSALAQAQLRDIFIEAGLEPVTMTPDEMRRFFLSEIDKWGKVIRDIGLKIQ
jgi:tripartite-type tricarboxylate transporter receptor subunit TctC